MHIIAKGAIIYHCDHFPTAKTALLTWYHQISKQKFKDFKELKEVYRNAGIVANNRVIFNIKGNEFRLIVQMNFQKAFIYIIWFGTHQAYNKADSTNIQFDSKILDYKHK